MATNISTITNMTMNTHEQGPSLNPLLTREIAVEAPVDEVAKAFQTVTKRYQKLARIPGFRAGKVPESLVRTKFARSCAKRCCRRWCLSAFAVPSASRSCSLCRSRSCWTCS